MFEKIKKNKVIIILICMVIVSSGWLITKGLPYQHDFEFHYSRLVNIGRSIRTGDFLSLVHNMYFGYGYAVGLFYSNFFFYIPSLLVLMGLPSVFVFKLTYVLINLFTVLISYKCFKSISKKENISLLATLIYMFSTYRIVDVYARGAYGEMLAFMLLPIAILGLYEIVFRDYKKWYLFTIGFVLLVLSHLISTALLAIFSVLFILINIKELFKDKNRLKYLILSGIVGVGLGLFFILPLLEQKLSGNINIFMEGSYYLPTEQITSLKYFLIPKNISSFKAFLGYSIILLIPIRLLIRNKKISDKKELKFADTLYILGLIAWVFITNVFPWHTLEKYVEFIQFPWRLLFITTGFLVFSYLIYFKILLENKYNKLLKIITCFVLVLAIFNTIVYSYRYGVTRKQYTVIDDNCIGTKEYFIYETDLDKLEIDNPTYTTNNPDMIVDYKKNGTFVTIKYSNNNESDTYIEVPLFNYLGYKATGAKLVNGENNLIRLLVNNESGTIKVSYGMTTIQKVSYIVSFVSLVGFISYIVIEKRKENGISKKTR